MKHNILRTLRKEGVNLVRNDLKGVDLSSNYVEICFKYNGSDKLEEYVEFLNSVDFLTEGFQYYFMKEIHKETEKYVNENFDNYLINYFKKESNQFNKNQKKYEKITNLKEREVFIESDYQSYLLKIKRNFYRASHKIVYGRHIKTFMKTTDLIKIRKVTKEEFNNENKYKSNAYYLSPKNKKVNNKTYRYVVEFNIDSKYDKGRKNQSVKEYLPIPHRFTKLNQLELDVFLDFAYKQNGRVIYYNEYLDFRVYEQEYEPFMYLVGHDVIPLEEREY